MIINEIWKPIRNFNGYEVSSLGEVRRITTPKSNKPRLKKLTTKTNSLGKYQRVQLWKNGKCYWTYIHRIVATEFLPEPAKKMTQVHHKNGNTFDNKLYNLEWVTPEKNKIYSYPQLIRTLSKIVEEYNAKFPEDYSI